MYDPPRVCKGLSEGVARRSAKMYPAYCWSVSTPGHDGVRARLASQMVRSMTTAFFDQAWDVWVDRAAILVKSPAEPGGIEELQRAARDQVATAAEDRYTS
jgi:hypothetical protein